ncbi:MAG: hypothetical protein ACNI25_16055 [Halarcobacter sp.]
MMCFSTTEGWAVLSAYLWNKNVYKPNNGSYCELPNVYNAKGGKQNIRDTELEGYSKEELDRMYRDPNVSKKMKQRIKKHQKALQDRHSSAKK